MLWAFLGAIAATFFWVMYQQYDRLKHRAVNRSLILLMKEKDRLIRHLRTELEKLIGGE